MASDVTADAVRPRFAEFEALARSHARVPVWAELELPGLAPPDAYERLAIAGRAFVLEGVSPEPGASRYSYVGHEIESVIRTGPAEPEGAVDPVALLRRCLAEMDVGKPSGLPPFFAGAAGDRRRGSCHGRRISSAEGRHPDVKATAQGDDVRRNATAMTKVHAPARTGSCLTGTSRRGHPVTCSS